MSGRRLRLLKAPVLFAIAGVVAAGCAQKQDPVGRLRAGAGEIELSYPGVSQVELIWEMARGLDGIEGEPVVFLHLLDANGGLVRTFDHTFPGSWAAGGELSYTVEIYQSALAPPLEEGVYTLTAGVYDRAGTRFPLDSASPERAANEYEISRVVVVDPGPRVPQFFFSSAWLAVEGGTDLQILGRRWTTGDGVIRLGDVSAQGTLWLRVGIPEGGGALKEPVLAEGATEQAVTVSTTCGSATARVSGSGSHVIELPIGVPAPDESGAESGACLVSFVANYYLEAREGDERRTLALEGLSWKTAQ